MATLRCPVCQSPVDPKTSLAMPFCSPRCRQVDLGRWLDERHTLPIYRFDDDEQDTGGDEDSAAQCGQ